MSDQSLKDYIINNLFTKTGKINTAIIRRETFLKGKTHQDIIENTPNIQGTLSERIYCIVNDLETPPKCEGCLHTPLRFKTFQTGYERFCSNKCARKIITWKSSSSVKKEKSARKITELLECWRDKTYRHAEESLQKKWIEERIERKSATYIYSNDYRENKDMLCSILTRTDYLEVNSPINWSERFYHILNNLNEPVANKYCPEELASYENINVGYRHKYNSNWLAYVSERIKTQNFQVLENKEFKSANTSKVDILCDKCGTILQKDLSDGKWQSVFCHTCYGDPNSSRQEKEVVEYIRSIFTGEIQENVIIHGKELDIFLPEKNIGFEYNGLIWHSFGSSFPSNATEERKKKHHLFEKTEHFKKHGIRVYHIFSNEWENTNTQEIWKSVIRNCLKHSDKIFARKCQVREINSETRNNFMFKNHIQGIDHSRICLGLYLANELVSVMTFNKPRFTNKENIDYELVRFCGKRDTCVVGGAGKLLKYFENKYTPKGIVSYADLRRSDGNLYHKLAFKLSHQSDPNYFYFKANRVVRRYAAQKGKLQKILKDGFDPNLSESANMFQNGYRRVWDCGNMVFLKVYTK